MEKINELFNLELSPLKEFFNRYIYPYEVLPNIHDYIIEYGNSLSSDYIRKDNTWIHKSVSIEDGVEIIGPAIIMEGVKLKHNAYIRENVIVGPYSVVGNSCEIKNSILISNCEVPHFNYVGDSILGNKAHLGAGVILANLRLDKNNIIMDKQETNLRKIGAFIGDNTQIGCNSVICPGTTVLPNNIIYPLSVIKGIYDGNKKNIEVERL